MYRRYWYRYLIIESKCSVLYSLNILLQKQFFSEICIVVLYNVYVCSKVLNRIVSKFNCSLCFIKCEYYSTVYCIHSVQTVLRLTQRCPGKRPNSIKLIKTRKGHAAAASEFESQTEISNTARPSSQYTEIVLKLYYKTQYKN